MFQRAAWTHLLRLVFLEYEARRPAGNERNGRDLVGQKERIALTVGRVCQKGKRDEEQVAAIDERGHTCPSSAYIRGKKRKREKFALNEEVKVCSGGGSGPFLWAVSRRSWFISPASRSDR